MFLATKDLQGAMRLTYRDESIVARPFIAGTVECSTDVLNLRSPPGGGSELRVPYRDLYFVDVSTYTARRISSRPSCARELAALAA